MLIDLIHLFDLKYFLVFFFWLFVQITKLSNKYSIISGWLLGPCGVYEFDHWSINDRSMFDQWSINDRSMTSNNRSMTSDNRSFTNDNRSLTNEKSIIDRSLNRVVIDHWSIIDRSSSIIDRLLNILKEFFFNKSFDVQYCHCKHDILTNGV